MIRLLQGDCLDAMGSIPAGSIDLVLADLPYGRTANRWDAIIPFEPLWAHYRRLLKPLGAVVLTASQPFTSMLVTSNPRWFRHEWVWIKNRGSNFANTAREPMKEHETALVFAPGRWTYNRQMQERTGKGLDRTKYPRVTPRRHSTNYGAFPGQYREWTDLRVPSSWQKFNTEVGLHPTQKPVPLMEYLVLTYSNEGETILDNAMGSGTTGVACMNTGRSFIGIEKDPDIFAVAETRINQGRTDAA